MKSVTAALPFSLAFLALRVSGEHSNPLAVRKSHSSRSQNLQTRDDGGPFYGQATYFADGLGACGWFSGPNDAIVALNSCMYNGGEYCGKSLSITGLGKTFTAIVADECPGCACGSLDMSQGFFENFANTAVGTFPISWVWGTDGGDDATTTTTTQEHTTTSTRSTTSSTTSTTSSSLSTATTSSISVSSATGTATSTQSATTTSGTPSPQGQGQGTPEDTNPGFISAQQQLVSQFGNLAAYGKANGT